MSIKNKMKFNANLLLLASFYMIVEWHEAEIVSFVKPLVSLQIPM